MFDPWSDQDATSTHRDGHKVGLFVVEGKLEWWAYPSNWKPRGSVEAKVLDPTNWQNWITPQIDFERGAVEPQRKAM